MERFKELQTVCYVWTKIQIPGLLMSSAKLAAQTLLSQTKYPDI